MKNRGIIAVLVLALFLMGGCTIQNSGTTDQIYSMQPTATPEPVNRTDTFDDNTLPKFWNAVKYVSLEYATDALSFQDGILTMTDKEKDRAPILVSQPIPLSKGQTLTITRKVKLHYANEQFNGAMTLYGTAINVPNFIPGVPIWQDAFGDMLTNVDYLHNNNAADKKPTKDGFVLYNVSENGMTTAKIIKPTFDKFYTEKLVYDASTGKCTWTIGGKSYTAQGLPLAKNFVVLTMYSSGGDTGHTMALDSISVQVKPTEATATATTTIPVVTPFNG